MIDSPISPFSKRSLSAFRNRCVTIDRIFALINSDVFNCAIIDYLTEEQTYSTFQAYDYSRQGGGWLSLAFELWAVGIEWMQVSGLPPNCSPVTLDGKNHFLTAWIQAGVLDKFTQGPIWGPCKKKGHQVSFSNIPGLLTLRKGILPIPAGRWTRLCIGLFGTSNWLAVSHSKHKSSNIEIAPTVGQNIPAR